MDRVRVMGQPLNPQGGKTFNFKKGYVMGTNYARIIIRSAFLSRPFGKDYAMRVFDLSEDQLESIVGRYTKGKRKGELRGILEWYHAEKGGWYKTEPGYMRGGVVKKNARFGHRIILNQKVVLGK